MTVTYSTNLKLIIDDTLTASARRNLEKLDALGAVLQIDSAGVAQLRSSGNVQIEPNSSAKGGTGLGGSVTVGTSAHDISDLTVYASTVSFPGMKTRARGAIQLGDSDTSNFVGLRAPATVSADLTWTLPGADGSAGQMIKTDGAGTLGWASPLANPATTTGDMLYSSDDSGTLARLGIGATGTVLHGGTTPSWSAVVDADISASAAVSLSKLVALTASRALVSDASGVISPSAVTSTELGYLSGVTSAVQTQIDSKLDLAGGTLTGDLTLAQDPTASLHAATKQYVDAAINGVEVKAGVRAASTGNLALTGEQTIDGVACVAGDRVLAKDQTDTTENGVYVVAAGTWTRALDANSASELDAALVTVGEGTENANTGWYQSAELTTLGVDSPAFVQFFGAGTYTADGQGIEISGSTFSLELDGTSLAKSASGLRVNTTGAPVGTTDTQTLSGKSLTGAIVTDYMEFAESAAPTTPASGKARGYVGTDKKLHIVDSTGADTQVGSGSGGELNVISNPDDANAVWTATGSGMTVDTTNTSGELPLEGVVDTGIKITNVSGTTDEVQCDFEVPVALRSTKLKLEWRQLIESGFGASDTTVDIKSYSDSGRTLDETVYALTTDDSSSNTYVPAGNGKFTTYFTTDDRQYYRLVLKRAAGTKYVVIVRVIVGPGIQPQASADSAPQTYTPEFTGSTANGTVSYTNQEGFWYLDNGVLCGAIWLKANVVTSAPTGSLGFSLPTGLTPNATLMTGSQFAIGEGTFWDSSSALTNKYIGVSLKYSGATGKVFVVSNDTDVAPPTLATGDELSIKFRIPVNEYSGNLNVAQNEIQHAAYDGTTTVYGIDGAVVPSITATADNTVTTHTLDLQYPMQDDEVPVLYARRNGETTFVLVGQGAPYVGYAEFYESTAANRRYYGMGVERVAGSRTQVAVVFGNAGAVYPTTIGNATRNYPITAGDHYRVDIVKAAQAVGFGAATETSLGLIKSGAPVDITSDVTVTNSTNVTASTLGSCSYWITDRTVHVNFVLSSVTITTGSNLSAISLTLPSYLAKATTNAVYAPAGYALTSIQPRIFPAIVTSLSSQTAWTIETSPNSSSSNWQGSFTYHLDD